MSSGKKLKKYKAKRDFRKTPEPSGQKQPEGVGRKGPIFVIQKHQASRLHYDFRLEADGVLKSWAVPKGPSTDPSVKRLAQPTEDHPLDYALFEGNIPEDEYGGGTVMIWDMGLYENRSTGGKGKDLTIAEAIEAGKVEIWLEGEKIRGGYVLVKTGSMGGRKESWLLIKKDDEHADARRKPTSTQNKSVKSDRTLDEIRRQEEETSFQDSRD
ncbi:MAG: DNA polymerase ligase N-terminal domain-containing protein [Phycisphaerae bacterium]